MNWITLLELALIHEHVIQETGGVHGITNPGGLESALARPFTTFGGVELFPNLISKVAALIHSLIAFHPFADGNKRTAKVRIIGRVYMTGLERKGKRDRSKGIYETVAELFCKDRIWIDPKLEELRQFKRLSEPAYEKILTLHGTMVRLLRSGTKSKLNFRSFVSKYLHFHIPIVPIFDSQASSTISDSEWYPWKKFQPRFGISKKKEFDPIYYKFFRQFLVYFEDLEGLKVNPSVRRADWYLISYE